MEERGSERNRRMNNEEEREKRYLAINFVIEDRENSRINTTFDLKPVTAIKYQFRQTQKFVTKGLKSDYGRI